MLFVNVCCDLQVFDLLVLDLNCRLAGSLLEVSHGRHDNTIHKRMLTYTVLLATQ